MMLCIIVYHIIILLFREIEHTFVGGSWKSLFQTRQVCHKSILLHVAGYTVSKIAKDKCII